MFDSPIHLHCLLRLARGLGPALPSVEPGLEVRDVAAVDHLLQVELHRLAGLAGVQMRPHPGGQVGLFAVLADDVGRFVGDRRPDVDLPGRLDRLSPAEGVSEQDRRPLDRLGDGRHVGDLPFDVPLSVGALAVDPPVRHDDGVVVGERGGDGVPEAAAATAVQQDQRRALAVSFVLDTRAVCGGD